MLRAILLILTRQRASLGIAHLHLSHRGSFVREGLVAVVARWRGLPVVLSLHGSDLPVWLPAHPLLARLVLHRADEVLVLGREMSALIKSAAPDVRVTEIPNPVTIPDQRPVRNNPPLAVFGGLVSKRKGVDVLLEAWQQVHDRLPAAILLVAGPVDPSIEIRKTVGVEFVGSLQHQEFLRVLEGARLLVLPSRLEAMPIAVLEAMARGIPVVVTDVGALAETVGGGGRVVPTEDAPALAAAMTDILADPDLAANMGTVGRARCAERHGDPVVTGHLESVYARVWQDKLSRATRRGGGASHPATAQQDLP